LEWLEQEVLALPAGTRVQRWAQQALLDDVLDARRVLSQKALEESPDADPADAVAAFLDAREAPRRRLTAVARALRTEGDGDLAGLTLAIRHLRGLAG
jgi:glutamate dehydrogenase